MERRTIDSILDYTGYALAAVAAALLIPATKRRIGDFAEEKLERLGPIDAKEVAAHAGQMAAKAALSTAGTQAAMKMKDQIFP